MALRTLPHRIRSKYKADGITGLLSRCLTLLHSEFVQPLLPRTDQCITYNGVKIQHYCVGDSVVPWTIPPAPDNPKYEAAIVASLREHVTEGDEVVVVGGGWGVSTTVAAMEAGQTGHVTTYEGAHSKVEDVQNTIQLNGVSDRVSISHAIIGEEISLHGRANNAEMLPPEELPDCDVLVLDCEGAELTILDNLLMRPRIVIVETHTFLGAPESNVRELLAAYGYEVISKDVADPTKRAFCEENGIHVLVAVVID